MVVARGSLDLTACAGHEYIGGFSICLGNQNALYVEIMGVILAIEHG